MQIFFNILTVLGFLLTFLGTYLTIKSGSSEEVLSNGLIFWLLIISVITASGWYIYFHKFYIIKSVLRGRSELQQVHNTIIDVEKQSKKNIGKYADCLKELSVLCQHIACGMRRFHSSEIAVNVHYLNREKCENGVREYVEILARNTDSIRHRKNGMKVEKDYIEHNTDFSTVIYKMQNCQQNDHYYFCNWLCWNPYYKNSHLTKFFLIHPFLGLFCKWPLPYRSAIVVPIKTEDEGKQKIWGFLSIDSNKSYAFSKKYDLPIMMEMAETIAPFVRKICMKFLSTSLSK